MCYLGSHKQQKCSMNCSNSRKTRQLLDLLWVEGWSYKNQLDMYKILDIPMMYSSYAQHQSMEDYQQSNPTRYYNLNCSSQVRKVVTLCIQWYSHSRYCKLLPHKREGRHINPSRRPSNFQQQFAGLQ